MGNISANVNKAVLIYKHSYLLHHFNCGFEYSLIISIQIYQTLMSIKIIIEPS